MCIKCTSSVFLSRTVDCGPNTAILHLLWLSSTLYHLKTRRKHVFFASISRARVVHPCLEIQKPRENGDARWAQKSVHRPLVHLSSHRPVPGQFLVHTDKF